MTNTMRRVAWLAPAAIAALLAFAPTAPALAAGADAGAGRIDRTVEASRDGVVSLEMLAGRVEIVGWDRAAVQVSGSYGRDVEEVEIDTDGGEVSIEVELRGGKTMHHAEADLKLRVPRGSSLEIETISAGIIVEDVTGAVEIETVSGRVTLIGGSDEIEIATVSGGIEVRAAGSIDELELASVSGAIDFEGEARAGGDLSFETVSGSITVVLTGTIAADFSIETFSGSIDNEFGPKPTVAKFVPSKSLEFTEGRGGADISIESFSGRIRLRRK